jgi:hypothetical protein
MEESVGKIFGIALVLTAMVVGAREQAQAASTSSKLVTVSNPGACILPAQSLLTIMVTSQRVEVPKASGIQTWFTNPTTGIIAEFDVTLTSPTDGADQRTFPAAKTVGVDGSRALDIVRVLNQFAPIRKMKLQVDGFDGMSSPFASIDAQIFLVRKTGDSSVTKIANAIEAIGGSVPNLPWAAGTRLYGNLIKQMSGAFGSGDDSNAKLPSANVSLQHYSLPPRTITIMQKSIAME